MQEDIRVVVQETVKETLISIGIDPREPIKTQQKMQTLHEISEMFKSQDFQADLTHLRKWRVSVNQISNVGIRTAVGIVVTGFFGFLIYAIKTGAGK